MYFGEVTVFLVGIVVGIIGTGMFTNKMVTSALPRHHSRKDNLPRLSDAKLDFLREKSFTMLTRLQGIIGIADTLLVTKKNDIDTKDLKIMSEGARQIHNLLTEGLGLHVNKLGETVDSITPAPVSDRRVLLVEDDETMRLTCSEMLKALGLEFDVAVNGQEGVEKVKDRNYGLVIMDCEMPKMDGYEATLAIRQMKGKQEINILGFTANALKSAVDKCLAVGMNSYLSKPVRLNELRSAITKFIPDAKV